MTEGSVLGSGPGRDHTLCLIPRRTFTFAPKQPAQQPRAQARCYFRGAARPRRCRTACPMTEGDVLGSEPDQDLCQCAPPLLPPYIPAEPLNTPPKLTKP